MNYSKNEDQVATTALASQILSDKLGDDYWRGIENVQGVYDAGIWQAIADAGLLGLGISESQGGCGFSFLEACLVAEEAGRYLAPVPFVESLAMVGMPLSLFGSEAQIERYLRPMLAGEICLTAALGSIENRTAQPESCAVRRSGDEWRLNGIQYCVPYAEQSAVILLAAQDADSGQPLIVVVPTDAEGVMFEPIVATSYQPQAHVEFRDVVIGPEFLLGTEQDAEKIQNAIRNWGMIALAASATGIASEALERTARYVSERTQFDRPIGGFQAVASRAADAYIDLQAMSGAYTYAAWRVSQDLPADTAACVAKWWAAKGSDRIVHTAQHLHGGIAADITYPLHRYYLLAKQLQLSLGNSAQLEVELGEHLAGSSFRERVL